MILPPPFLSFLSNHNIINHHQTTNDGAVIHTINGNRGGEYVVSLRCDNSCQMELACDVMAASHAYGLSLIVRPEKSRLVVRVEYGSVDMAAEAESLAHWLVAKYGHDKGGGTVDEAN